MEEKKFLSVVLCTVGRYGEVENFLSFFKGRSLPDCELIIVDQNKDDRLTPLHDGLQSQIRVTIVKQAEAHLSKARNAGLKRCSGEYVIFADDDSELPSDYVERARDMAARHPDCDVVTGITKDKDNRISICKFGSLAHPVTFSNIWFSMTAGATLYKRTVFDNGNLFDEDFGYNARYRSAEDIEIGLRMLKQNRRIVFDPALFVYHPQTVTTWSREERRKMECHGVGVGAAIRKHIDRHNANYLGWFFVERITRAFVAAMFYLVCAPDKSKGYFLSLTGRVRGFLGYRKK